MEKYPEFVPFCDKGNIIESKDGFICAELGVGFGVFAKTYKSKILHGAKDLINESDPQEFFIDITQLEGPFEYLNTSWRFISQGEKSTMVHFDMEFSLQNKLYESMINPLFNNMTNLMIEAFEKRAKEIYGNS